MGFINSKEGTYYYYDGFNYKHNIMENSMSFTLACEDRHLIRRLIRRPEWKVGSYIDVLEIGSQSIFGLDQDGYEKCYPIGGKWEFFSGLRKCLGVKKYNFPYTVGDRVKLKPLNDSSAVEIKYVGEKKFVGINNQGNEVLYSFGEHWNWVVAEAPGTLAVGCCFSIESENSTERCYFKVESWGTHLEYTDIVYNCVNMETGYRTGFTLPYLKTLDFRLENNLVYKSTPLQDLLLGFSNIRTRRNFKYFRA